MTSLDSGIGYGRNYDGSAGDVLERLRQKLETAPHHSLATVLLRRSLVEAVVEEIVRLRRLVDGGGS